MVFAEQLEDGDDGLARSIVVVVPVAADYVDEAFQGGLVLAIPEQADGFDVIGLDGRFVESIRRLDVPEGAR